MKRQNIMIFSKMQPVDFDFQTDPPLTQNELENIFCSLRCFLEEIENMFSFFLSSYSNARGIWEKSDKR